MDGVKVDWGQQLSWTLAIVATLLLIILLVYDLFSEEEEQKMENRHPLAFNARAVLLFFTVSGWSLVALSYTDFSMTTRIIYSVLLGLVVAFSTQFIQYAFRRNLLGDAKNILTSTGQVMQSIPPHRAGSGKVHLRTRRLPVEVNAVTQGKELPIGAPVRVVGMIDEHTILVESLEEPTEHRSTDEIPPDPSTQLPGLP